MADNYLEKKMEAYRSGASIIRKVNPSLDTLLRKLPCSTAARRDDPVKEAQLYAALRSASLSGLEFESEVLEGEQKIRVSTGTGSEMDWCRLGQIVAIVRLKAAELGFLTECSFEDVPATDIFFYKSA